MFRKDFWKAYERLGNSSMARIINGYERATRAYIATLGPARSPLLAKEGKKVLVASVEVEKFKGAVNAT